MSKNSSSFESINIKNGRPSINTNEANIMPPLLGLDCSSISRFSKAERSSGLIAPYGLVEGCSGGSPSFIEIDSVVGLITALPITMGSGGATVSSWLMEDVVSRAV
jgi:hypothetical protein